MNAKITITQNYSGYGLGLLIGTQFHTCEIDEKDYNDFMAAGVPWNEFQF